MISSQSLLIEEIDFASITNLVESDQASGTKRYLIRGPHIECNIKNRNERIYPSPVVKPQVESYQGLISDNRAVGELNHPDSLEIDPKNISHKATKLEWVDDNVVFGESLILDTPNGLIVKKLMDEKIKLGTSSRGSGTLKEGVVQKDYNYICNDIVWQPSAPNCFVEGILESDTQWAIDNGVLVEKQVNDFKDRLRNFRGKDIADVIAGIFEDTLRRNMRK